MPDDRRILKMYSESSLDSPERRISVPTIPSIPAASLQKPMAYTAPSSPERRLSVLQVDSTPATPLEETTAQRLSRAASKFRAGSRSRPTSSSDENRKSWFEGPPRRGHTSTDDVIEHKKEAADQTKGANKGAKEHKKDTKGKMPANGHGHKMKLHKQLPERECVVM